MCGINGIFSFGGRAIPDAPVLIRRMNELISYRGPDDEGYFNQSRDSIFLGHRRLSILDLSEAGHQPMLGRNGNALVYNGEIYNYRELRKMQTDCIHKSDSDTEVLLNQYEIEAEDMFQGLVGMFAFGIWDGARKRLLLARDRIGEKPLYYNICDEVVSFSSELRSLFVLPWIQKRLDYEDVFTFLTYGRLHAPKTMFQDICKLEPGHFLSISRSDGVRKQRYWNLEIDPKWKQIGLEEAQEEVRRMVTESIAMRMVSDVPIGAFLSGGVDSSIIVQSMRATSQAEIHTFTVGFDGQPSYNELKYAREISSAFRTTHHEYLISKDDLTEFLPTIAEVFDEPLSDPTCIPIYYISRLARDRNVKVILTGDGSDESFAGYRNWVRYLGILKYLYAYNRLPIPVKRMILQAVSRLGNWPVVLDYLFLLAKNIVPEKGSIGFKLSVVDKLYRKEFLDSIDPLKQVTDHKREREQFFLKWSRSGNTGEVDWMCYEAISGSIPDFYLHRADRLGMANSIEIRVPFLDHRLVQMAVSLPSSYKIHKNIPKYILKSAYRGILSDDILFRRKMGFCVPIAEWVGEKIRNEMLQSVDQFCRDIGIFNKDYLRSGIEGGRGVNRNSAFRSWGLYFLMCWHRRWFRH